MSNDTVSASATAQRVSDDKVIDSFIMLDRWEAGRKKPDSAKFAHTHFIVFNTSIPCPQRSVSQSVQAKDQRSRNSAWNVVNNRLMLVANKPTLTICCALEDPS